MYMEILLSYHFLNLTLLFGANSTHSRLPADTYVARPPNTHPHRNTSLCFVPLKSISSEMKVFTEKKMLH